MRIANLLLVALKNRHFATGKTLASVEKPVLAEYSHNDRSPLAALVSLSWEKENAADAASR
jgi:hypothetical protein